MARDEYDDEDEDEIELVLFQGAVNGKEANLKDNSGLVRAGLIPAKELVSDAISRRAEKLVVELRGDRAQSKFMVDGMPFRGPTLPGRRALAITQMLKLLSGLDHKNKKDPQTGGIKAEYDEKKYTVLVKTSPGNGGERLTVQIADPSQTLRKPSDVEMTDELKNKIRGMTSDRSGVLLICGPPESGVSTSAFVLLHTIDSYIYSVYAIADFTGRDPINISEYKLEEGESYDVALEKIIRKEADTLYLENLDDPEIMKLAFENHSRLGFLGEYTASDPATAVLNLVEQLGDAKLVTEGLRGVFTQKLVRRLCHKCREAYRPNPRMLAKLGLPPETKVLYRQQAPPDPEEEIDDDEPCVFCDDVGFRGRVATFELLEMSDEIKQLVVDGADAAAIRKQARSEGQITLQKDALRLVAAGITSMEEVKRVFSPGKPKRRRR